MSLGQQYGTLLAALKQHIREEYASVSAIAASYSNFEYFKQHALQSPSKSSAAVRVAPPTPPPRAKENDSTAPTRPKESIAAAPPPLKAISLSDEGKESPKSEGPAKETHTATQEVSPPVQELQKPSKSTSPSKKKAFERAPPLSQVEMDLSDLHQYFSKTFPHIELQASPLPDDAAKAYQNRWRLPGVQTEILVLSFGDQPKELLFLKNLTHALDVEIGRAALFSAEKAEFQGCWKELLRSPALSLVIAHKGKMETLPGLMSYYREEPRAMLDRVALYPLCDISLYIQEPALKIELWKALLQSRKKTF